MTPSQKNPSKAVKQDSSGKLPQFEKRILGTSSIGVLITRINDGTILYANQAIAGLLGLPDTGEIIGKPVPNFYWDAKDREVVLERFRAEGSVKNHDLCARRSDDSVIWVSISIQPFDYEGEQVLLSEITDITSRKQAEQAQRASEEQFRSLYNNSTIGLYRTTPEGQILMINPTGLRLLGFDTFEELAKRNLEEAGFEEVDARKNFRERLEREGVIEQESVWTRKDGTPIFVREGATVSRDENGNVLYYDGSFEDITARKQAEEALRESEDRFRRFTEATIEGLVFHEQGVIVDANPAALAMFGLSRSDEFIGRNLLEFVVPESRQLVLQQMQLETVHPYEIQCTRTDGSLFPVETSTRIYKVGEHTIRASAIRDISVRKRAEEELRAERDFNNALVEASPAFLVTISGDGKVRSMNQSMLQALGYTLDEVEGKDYLTTIVSEEERPMLGGVFARLTDLREPTLNENHVLTKDGRLILVEWHGRPVLKPNGEFDYFFGLGLDITERKKTEDSLVASEKTYRGMLNALSEAIYVQDPQGRFLDVNDGVARMYGHPREYYIGKTPEIVSAPGKNDMDMANAAFEKTLAGEPQQFEFWGIRKNGEVFPKEVRQYPGEFFGQKVVIVAAEDITERKQAEELVRQSETRFRSIFDNANDAIFLMQGAAIIDSNPRAAQIYGATHDQVIGKTPVDFSPETQPDGQNSAEKAGAFIELALAGQPQVFEWKHERLDGTLFDAEISLNRVEVGGETYMQAIIRDITDRKRLEREVQEAFEKRGYQVQVSTEIAQEVAAASGLSDLFERVVALTKERFGYYHTQLLRYDAIQDAVVLINGYGETGRKMLEGSHRMPMGSGLIGTAAATGETVMRSTLEEDIAWQPNPLLPDTKGEIAVPIKFGDQVLGVLDVQSDQAGALTEDDRLLLEGLCGQVAVAMEQTRLRQEMAERLEEVNRLYRSMSREGWKTYRETADLPNGFMFDQAGVRPVEEAALNTENFTSIPMKVLGGEVVGSLAIANDPQRPMSTEDITFLQQVSDQVALALEGARLTAQTQSALAQTEKLSDASLRFAQAGDLQELVQVAAETLAIPNINRAFLESFNYDSSGQLKAMTVIANWWNGHGPEPTPVGTVYSTDALKLLKLFANKEPVFLNNTFEDPRVDGADMEIVRQRDIRALASLPLFHGNEQVGALLLESEEPHDFTEDETRLFTAMGPQIATVLENRRQFERAQQQAEREGMLNIISQKIQSATTVEAVLQIAARELGHALGAPMTIAQLSMKDKK